MSVPLSAKHLFLHSFFQELKKKLGIAPDIEKYEQFLMLVQTYHAQLMDSKQGEPDYSAIYRWAESMFLYSTRESDQLLFRQIFLNAVVAETKATMDWINQLRNKEVKDTLNEQHQNNEKNEIAQEENKLSDSIEESNEEISNDLSHDTEEIKDESSQDEKTSEKFVNIDLGASSQSEKISDTKEPIEETIDGANKELFRVKEDYQPIGRRTMIQNWRMLRVREAFDYSDSINIKATVLRTAQEGLFLEPIYNKAKQQRAGSLLIFVDYRGSMTPFHSLTDALIDAALHEGGQTHAKVYYFQNYPNDHVYPKDNFFAPISLEAILRPLHSERIGALIISDAGAARGGLHQERGKATIQFIEKLREKIAYVAWLNPMPFDRWFGTTAELIARSVDMFPILDAEDKGLNSAVKLLIGKDIEGYKV